MPFLDDNSGNSTTAKKQDKRCKYLNSCLEEFSKVHPEKILFSPQVSFFINKTYWEKILPKIRSLMKNSNNRIDHHKIISGTQAAIMVCCLLRTEKYSDVPPETRAAKDIKELLDLNALFAIYVALNILEQWNKVDISPIKKRTCFLLEHKEWLKSVITCGDDGKFRFPFFSNSQLWYLVEELCKTERTST